MCNSSATCTTCILRPRISTGSPVVRKDWNTLRPGSRRPSGEVLKRGADLCRGIVPSKLVGIMRSTVITASPIITTTPAPPGSRLVLAKLRRSVQIDALFLGLRCSTGSTGIRHRECSRLQKAFDFFGTW